MLFDIHFYLFVKICQKSTSQCYNDSRYELIYYSSNDEIKINLKKYYLISRLKIVFAMFPNFRNLFDLPFGSFLDISFSLDKPFMKKITNDEEVKAVDQ